MESKVGALLGLFSRESEAVSSFLGLLREEQQVLGQEDSDALESLLVRKQLAIAELRGIEAERVEFFHLAGIAADKDSEEIFLFAGDESTELSLAWIGLLKLVRQVHEQHELNGQLIAAYQQKTGAALAVLLRAHGDLNLYNKGGTASPFSSRRLVDSA
ncbi:MAG: flagellar protein FlgN [Azonexus sp.]|nr:flagellar protein FlgN [Azonexus sp.]MCK6411227.1 flagellar protein FlgN [Azonexus sp.]